MWRRSAIIAGSRNTSRAFEIPSDQCDGGRTPWTICRAVWIAAAAVGVRCLALPSAPAAGVGARNLGTDFGRDHLAKQSH
jgi:hypothetical protein